MEEFTCALYGTPAINNIQETRFKLFKNSRKTPDPQKLPPTKDSLYLHFDRTNYQVYEWKQALQVNMVQLPPEHHGWKRTENDLTVLWMNNLPAPETILEFVVCKCKRTCEGNGCQCASVDLPCTDACDCKGCNTSDPEDKLTTDGTESEDDSELSDDSSDDEK